MSGFKELNICNEHRTCEVTDPQLANKFKKQTLKETFLTSSVEQTVLKPVSLSFKTSVRVTEYEQ